jgi:predicted membrane protein
MDRRMGRGHGGLVGGVVLAGIGLLLLLQNLGIPYFDDLERYWPVILIVLGIAQAYRSMGMGGRIWGAAIFLAGVIVLLNNFGIVHGDVWRFLWPGILIMIGLAMLAKAIDRQSYGGDAPAGMDPQAMADKIKNRVRSEMGSRPATGGASRLDQLEAWAVFSGVRRRMDTQDFQGGEAFAMFGGVEIDLRKAATTRDEILIEANAIFGGIEIRLPENWNVTVRGAGIFGGYEDETKDWRVASDTKQPLVIINGFAVFGGVTIKS